MQRLQKKLAQLLIAVVWTSLAGTAIAAYPERPLTLIVPFAAGGPTDVLARVVAESLTKVIGQSVIVENTPGAGGTVGGTRASRATGAAIGRNPIALLIPCHRVLASSGALTGYHWGVTRKRAMLALEAARAELR